MANRLTVRDHDVAKNFFENKLDAVPTMPKYNHCLAALKAASGDTATAEALYQTAIQNDPRHVMMRNDYALLVARKGNLSGSVDELKRALLINENQPTLHKNLGAVYARNGQYKVAEDHAKRAVNINERDPMSHRNLAKINEALGDSRTALYHNMKSIELEKELPSSEINTHAYRAAAVQTIAQGRGYDEALRLINEARKHEGAKYVSPTTERTNEIIKAIKAKQGTTIDSLDKEISRRKEVEALKARLLQEGGRGLLPKTSADAPISHF